MTAYIEIFRNVPVLLWIIVIFSIMIEVMSPPSAFRKGDASMLFNESVAITNRGVYIPEPLFHNTLGNIPLFGESSLRFDVSLDLIAFLVVLFAGIYAAMRVKRRADKIQSETGERPTTWWQRLALIFVPAAILLTVLGFHLGYPELKGFNFKGGTYMRNSLIALWLALSLVHRRIHRGKRPCRYSGRLQRPIRSGVRAGHFTWSHNEFGYLTTGIAHHHSTADFTILEPDEKHVTGDCGGLHGYDGHLDGDYVEPNRS